MKNTKEMKEIRGPPQLKEMKNTIELKEMIEIRGSRGGLLRQHPQYISPGLIEMNEMGPE